jgi:hypothetical protein
VLHIRATCGGGVEKCPHETVFVRMTSRGARGLLSAETERLVSPSVFNNNSALVTFTLPGVFCRR